MNHVFVQTNEARENRVVAFRRSGDGRLRRAGSYETGGAGDGVPHLTSQGSVVLTSDARHLLVANTGSGDVTVFAVADDGLERLAVVATGGAPKSLAEHDGLVYVLNTEAPSLVGFRLQDGLSELEGSRRDLPAESDPAQVGFAPDGRTLVVTQRGTNSIAVYPVSGDGLLGEPRSVASAGPTPYGFTFASNATLVVTEAFAAEKGKAAASSYVADGRRIEVVSKSIGNGRSEICWAVVANEGRHVFTTNFADGAVSRYAVDANGALELEDAVAGVTVDGRAGLRDEDVTTDGRYLYAVDSDSGTVFGWAVAEDGRLTPLGSWNGLPATAAGLAAS
jgi:6-phosphogluconolactonase